ncbi:hypothetical protein [Pyrolobus fumarii]|uniref:hypothetical protein n=1 Tax=Pyrolobus fumarii TaxID=54252 RepID=UPI001FCB83C6|nr:hypothetical protein [Pyrolobus fumarii]
MISVRIPRWVKEILERHGVDVSELVQRVLIEKAERLEEEELARLLDEVRARLSGRVDVAELVRLIDEERKR